MAETRVLSEVTGTVWKILVAEGARVAAGTDLMIVEAMKVEIPLAAPTGGTVKQVCVAPGDLVEEDALAFILES